MTLRTRLGAVAGVLLCGLTGWAAAGFAGTVAGLLIGLAVFTVRWHGLPAWSWAALFLRRNEPVVLTEPVPVDNDGATGAVRYSDGVAVTAVQLFGKPYHPTHLGRGMTQETVNALPIGELQPLMRQGLGLVIESISVVTLGARRRTSGDYPRVYDALLGSPPYAGRRETWLIVRIAALSNASALMFRDTVATAALAATQRIASALRRRGIRARVATAADIAGLEGRLGHSAMDPRRRRWHSLRADQGWLTTYRYRPGDLNSELLDRAWSLPAESISQNITVFPDGRCTATVTVGSPQPPAAPPSAAMQSIPGQQVHALASSLCGPRRRLRGLVRNRLPESLVVPLGASGVLLGAMPQGDRIALPFTDPELPTRVHIAATDPIAKRLIIRLCAAGERITLHSRDSERWRSVRMPGLTVTDQSRPAPDTTVSVVDGTLPPVPRSHTVISVGPPGQAELPAADVLITQSGPGAVRVAAAGSVHHVEIDLFRAENRYVTGGSASVPAPELARS